MAFDNCNLPVDSCTPFAFVAEEKAERLLVLVPVVSPLLLVQRHVDSGQWLIDGRNIWDK